MTEEIIFVTNISDNVVGKTLFGYTLEKIYEKDKGFSEEKTQILDRAVDAFGNSRWRCEDTYNPFWHEDDAGTKF